MLRGWRRDLVGVIMHATARRDGKVSGKRKAAPASRPWEVAGCRAWLLCYRRWLGGPPRGSRGERTVDWSHSSTAERAGAGRGRFLLNRRIRKALTEGRGRREGGRPGSPEGQGRERREGRERPQACFQYHEGKRGLAGDAWRCLCGRRQTCWPTPAKTTRKSRCTPHPRIARVCTKQGAKKTRPPAKRHTRKSSTGTHLVWGERGPVDLLSRRHLVVRESMHLLAVAVIMIMIVIVRGMCRPPPGAGFGDPWRAGCARRSCILPRSERMHLAVAVSMAVLMVGGMCRPPGAGFGNPWRDGCARRAGACLLLEKGWGQRKVGCRVSRVAQGSGANGLGFRV